MISKRKFLFGVSGLSILFFIASCGSTLTDSDKKTNVTPDDSVKTVDVFSGTVSTAGGKIIVDTGLIRGMTLSIPAGSFGTAQKVTISYDSVGGDFFKAEYKAISPLIQIGCANGYTDSLITVSIPVTIPAGQIAMPMLYDRAMKTFEGLPVTSITPASITFMTNAIGPRKTGGALPKTAGLAGSFSDMVIISIEESRLSGKSVIATGFRQLIDEWEFPNYGSYLEKDGHCAGQSITAMWYYYEKKHTTAPQLYHSFDLINTSKDVLWQDNPRGYRFASVVQADLQWDGKLRSVFTSLRSNPDWQIYVWKCFVFSMFITGEPQYVGLLSDSGGHAIIAYKASITDSLLYVADPNFPGEERTIKFSNGIFQPYSTKQNASEPDTRAYDKIGYFAKTSLINWDQIATRFSQFENNTIGTVPPNTFPPAEINYIDSAKISKPLPTPFTTSNDTLLLEEISNGCENSYSGSGRQFFEVFDTLGTMLTLADTVTSTGKKRGQAFLQLKTGSHRYGFALYGYRNVENKPGFMSRNWLDFKWQTIIKGGVIITPRNLKIALGKDTVFKASGAKSLAASVKYKWSFGDGTAASAQMDDSTVRHTYKSTGVFTLKVTVTDNATAAVVGRDSTRVYAGDQWPAITGISKDSLSWGDTMTIRGTGFSDSLTPHYCSFNDVKWYSTLSWNDSVIKVIIPDTAHTGELFINTGGRSSNSVKYSITILPIVITSISPAVVMAESTVTIRGRNFRKTGERGLLYRATSIYITPVLPDTNLYYLSSTGGGAERLVWNDSVIVLKLNTQARSGKIFVSYTYSIGSVYSTITSNTMNITVTHDAAKIIQGDLRGTINKIFIKPDGTEIVTVDGIVSTGADSAKNSGNTLSFTRSSISVSGNEKKVIKWALAGTLNWPVNKIENITGLWSEVRTDTVSGNITYRYSQECAITELPLSEITSYGNTQYLLWFSLTGKEVCNRFTQYKEEGSYTLKSIECTDWSNAKVILVIDK